MMSKTEIIDRYLASLLLHAQLTGDTADLSVQELNELLEAANAEAEPLMSPDQHIA